MKMEKKKRVPATYQPVDCQLVGVAKYAAEQSLTAARIYQLFQEDKIDLVEIDGKQFVQIPKP